MPAFDLQNYISVQERINAFWKDHPDGAIRTRLMSDPADFDRCRYEARVYTHRDHAEPDATGYAFELAGSGMANKTSHEENGETSCIGRALANLGYATTQETRPSREEMTKAVKAEPLQDVAIANRARQQPAPKSLYPPRSGPTDAQRNFMNGLAKDLGWVMVGQDGGAHHNPEEMDLEVSQVYPGKTVDTLTVSEASELIEAWKQKRAELIANPR